MDGWIDDNDYNLYSEYNATQHPVCVDCVAEYVDTIESDTVDELEKMIDNAKTRLFLLIDYATMTPAEMRLNSVTFSWPNKLIFFLNDCHVLIEQKREEFQDYLRVRRDQLLAELETYANQVRLIISIKQAGA